MTTGDQHRPRDRERMSAQESRWLASAKGARRVIPWVEYRCRKEGQRTHVLATVHPLGVVTPAGDLTPGVQSLPRIRVALWLRAGTITRDAAEVQSWPFDKGLTRIELAESVQIIDLDEMRREQEWWVACHDTITTFTAPMLVPAVWRAWRRQSDTPVRLFVTDPIPNAVQ